MPGRPLAELHAPIPQKGFDSQVLEFIWEGTAGGHLLNRSGGRGGISAVLRLQSHGGHLDPNHGKLRGTVGLWVHTE